MNQSSQQQRIEAILKRVAAGPQAYYSGPDSYFRGMGVKEATAAITTMLNEAQGSDLKQIISLLPKIVQGRELTINYDKSGWWYVGHPNLDGDYSVGLHACDRDVEGAALKLLSQFDKQAHLTGQQAKGDDNATDK